MDSYIIRVYRRHPEDPTAIEATVEVVEAGRSLPFRCAHELWAILLESQSKIVAKKKP